MYILHKAQMLSSVLAFHLSYQRSPYLPLLIIPVFFSPSLHILPHQYGHKLYFHFYQSDTYGAKICFYRHPIFHYHYPEPQYILFHISRLHSQHFLFSSQTQIQEYALQLLPSPYLCIFYPIQLNEAAFLYS